MTAPTGTFQTFAAIGEREDLEDIIYDISPMDTPFMANTKRLRAKNVFHEWQTDALAAASSTNAQIEGDDAVTNTSIPTVRLGNYCQISTKVPRVTGTLRATDTAGRADEMDYQTAKSGREIKRDIESALLGLQAATAGSAASARALAGVACWLWTNNVALGASATTPPVTAGAPTTAPTAGTAATFSEQNLKDVLKECWDSGGDPNVVMVGSWNKTLASAFGGIATQYRDNPQKGPATIIGAADVYVSNFSTVQIVANRFTPAANVYALDMEYWGVAYLRPLQRESLAKTGDSDRAMILAEYTLASHAPGSSGKVYTTTTS